MYITPLGFLKFSEYILYGNVIQTDFTFYRIFLTAYSSLILISRRVSMASMIRYYKGPTPLPPMVPDVAIDALQALKYRDDDVLIASYPKSGE